MAVMNIIQAINSALKLEMRRDERVVVRIAGHVRQEPRDGHEADQIFGSGIGEEVARRDIKGDYVISPEPDDDLRAVLDSVPVLRRIVG